MKTQAQRGVKTMLSKIKTLFRERIIVSVPVELQDQFDSLQLKNSIYRIRLLSVVLFISVLINPVIYFFANVQIEALGNQANIDYPLIIILVLFNLFIFLFRKFKKTISWIICYLLIASIYVEFYFTQNFIEITETLLPYLYFIKIFILVIVPDFKPRVFISFAALYYIATLICMTFFNTSMDISSDNRFMLQSQLMNVFFFIIITKILLYNSKVKTFVKTHEIKKINDNLEMLVDEKTKKIIELKSAVLETISELVERRDDSTGGHINRTSIYLKIFINSLIENRLYISQTSSWNVEQMILSAQLHDVGKISIDDSILRKPGKLTEEEFEIMKKHTTLGGDIIKDIQKKAGEREFLDYAYVFAVYHHEKWDGSGYPYGFSREDIPLPARLMAIIDVYDALISERPYKKPFSHEKAIEIIKDGKGIHFDPSLTKLFLSISDQLRKK